MEQQILLGTGAPSRARKVIRKDDVLVSTVRPNLNAVAMVPACLDGQIASTGFCVLRPNRGCVEPRYLFYWTITSTFVDASTSRVRGANYPAVSDRDVKEVAIPLPPLAEQRRIVEILDQADRLRRLRAEADAKANRILPALFIRMFGDPATNPMKWPRVRFRDLLSDIDSGWSPICEDRHASPSRAKFCWHKDERLIRCQGSGSKIIQRRGSCGRADRGFFRFRGDVWAGPGQAGLSGVRRETLGRCWNRTVRPAQRAVSGFGRYEELTHGVVGPSGVVAMCLGQVIEGTSFGWPWGTQVAGVPGLRAKPRVCPSARQFAAR